MTLFLRLRRATVLLTRGMERSLRHQQALQTALVGVGHERGLAEVPLPLGMLLGQDVGLVRVIAAQPASCRQLDALPEGALGFLFRHVDLMGVRSQVSGVRGPDTWNPTPGTFISAPAPSTCYDLRASGPARSWRCPSARSRPGPAPRVPGRGEPSADPGTSSSP